MHSLHFMMNSTLFAPAIWMTNTSASQRKEEHGKIPDTRGGHKSGGFPTLDCQLSVSQQKVTGRVTYACEHGEGGNSNGGQIATPISGTGFD